MNFKGISFFITIIIAGSLLYLVSLYIYSMNQNIKEGFNIKHAQNISSSNRLLDTYPSTEKNTVSGNSYDDIWWYYPIFKVGSYAQITNNLRHRKNPDDGECITAEFCGALYKDAVVDTNVIAPLPPVSNSPGIRVNYYRTPDNLHLGPQPGREIELPAF